MTTHYKHIHKELLEVVFCVQGSVAFSIHETLI